MSPGTPSFAALRMEFRFRWDAGEHRALYRAVQRDVHRRGALKWFLRAGLAMLPAATLVMIAMAPESAGKVLRAVAPYFVVLAIWIAFFQWGMPWLSARSYRRAHAPCILNDQVRGVTADGIEASCVTSNVGVRWHGIVRVVETAEFFLFFTTPSCAIALPKRAVPDAAALTALRSVLVAQSGARADVFTSSV